MHPNYLNNKIYKEEDKPNLDSLYYSKLRIKLEEDLDLTNVLYLRILYPISGDGHNKCFLSKLKTRLESIHDIKINCTILQDILPSMFSLIENNETGIYNFVNPGSIRIPDILNIIDSNMSYLIVKTVDESPHLNVDKLLNKYPKINNVIDAL